MTSIESRYRIKSMKGWLLLILLCAIVQGISNISAISIAILIFSSLAMWDLFILDNRGE